ncbi:MAG: hypothetical protein WCO94_14585 [Verrucomicrobiota bacterium]
MKTTNQPNTNGHLITEEELHKSKLENTFEKAGHEMAELTDEELERITDAGGITIQHARTTWGHIMITQKRGDRTHAIVFPPSAALRLADSIREHVNFIPDLLSGKFAE